MLRKVLFPTDLSETSFKALEVFGEINEMTIEDAIILHVVERNNIDLIVEGYSLVYEPLSEDIEDLRRKLVERRKKILEENAEKFRKMLNARKIKIIVRVGIPYKEIVKVADEEDVNLIILSAHGKLGFSEEIMGSTTLRVIRKTNKPVLIIKTKL